MRNEREYPYTLTEVIDCLKRLKAEALKEESCGDPTALLLDKAIKIVERERFFYGE